MKILSNMSEPQACSLGHIQQVQGKKCMVPKAKVILNDRSRLCLEGKVVLLPTTKKETNKSRSIVINKIFRLLDIICFCKWSKGLCLWEVKIGVLEPGNVKQR